MNEIALIILKAAKAAYNADRANVYINQAPFEFDIKIRVPYADAKYWRFVPNPDGISSHVTLKAYGRKNERGIVICDGASFSPDSPKGVKKSAGMHDPGYLDIDAIAEQWKDEKFDPGENLKRDWFMRKPENWTKEDVRLLMDAMFGDSIRKLGGSPLVERVYYNAVRYCGGIFRTLPSFGIPIPDKLPLAVVASSLIAGAGCSSCLKTPDILDGQFTGPNIEKADSSTTNTSPSVVSE